MKLEQHILDQMKNIGVNISNIMSATSTVETALIGLTSKRDEMPEGIFDQLDKSLKETRTGKNNMKSALADIDKTLKNNGNPNSK